MKVQHLFPQTDRLIAEHVRMLGDTSVEAGADIIHIHGCWDKAAVRQALAARKQGARIVFTPHGGLEPWHVSARRRQDRTGSEMRWQRRLAERSYVVIVQGRMEAEALESLAWNSRIEVVRNAVITNSITPEAMAEQTQAIYRRVMDSNTIEKLSDDGRRLLSMLLKAGITGDRRWVTGTVPNIDDAEWRRLLVYADHENVRTTVDTGCHVLGVKQPYIDTRLVSSYMPSGYKRPEIEATDVAGIVGESRRKPLNLRLVVELDRALRRADVDDERLCDTLAERYQLGYFRRLLALLAELTGLDEGFWPTMPVNDRRTRTLRNLLNNHLRI